MQKAIPDPAFFCMTKAAINLSQNNRVGCGQLSRLKRVAIKAPKNISGNN